MIQTRPPLETGFELRRTTDGTLVAVSERHGTVKLSGDPEHLVASLNAAYETGRQDALDRVRRMLDTPARPVCNPDCSCDLCRQIARTDRVPEVYIGNELRNRPAGEVPEC